ncbi:hypothetical protein CK203_086889 [Vitis vinifera]|uniref:Uncharacterized protein n=1 Tax=Vitis vinifera TaxID=29760 RepID=A0A438EA22_VITVI|nr:hypothetical protein CK203_086889 [Vitis vinifera]
MSSERPGTFLWEKILKAWLTYFPSVYAILILISITSTNEKLWIDFFWSKRHFERLVAMYEPKYEGQFGPVRGSGLLPIPHPVDASIHHGARKRPFGGKMCWGAAPVGRAASKIYDALSYVGNPDLIIPQALPDDLKTKLSIDEDMVSSPKEALSRFSADSVAMRNKHFKSGMSHSYSTHRDKNLSNHTGFSVSNRKFDDRPTELPAMLANKGAITQLSEQISSLNDRMDEFTSQIEELNSKLTMKKVSASQQNLAFQAEASNGSAPTFFIPGIGNGSLTGTMMHKSSSSSQLAKELPLMEEILGIARSQRQVMHQLDNISSLVREDIGGGRSEGGRRERKSIMLDIEPTRVPLILALAVGGLGIFLFKAFLPRN